MRNLSRTMIGLLLGAAIVMPAVTQAQEQGHGRGGWQGGGGGNNGGGNGGGGQNRGGWQGGGDRGGQQQGGAQQGGWQRSGGQDRGAMMNGDARREAVQQGREAARAVERPAPVAPQPHIDVANDAGRRSGGGWNRGDSGRWNGGDNGHQNVNRGYVRRGAADAALATEVARENATQRSWNGGGNNDNRDHDRGGDRDNRRDSRAGDHNRNGNWDRDHRNDGNRNWTTDRRDWNHHDGNNNWDRNWRNDQRYSWQSYRNHNRNVYRLPRYEARHGYSYRRWYPGYRFDPFFYSSTYWISDPFYYRLPPAYGDYRWVRYYDDAVLVDVRTGEIVDIIYSFFF